MTALAARHLVRKATVVQALKNCCDVADPEIINRVGRQVLVQETVAKLVFVRTRGGVWGKVPG